MRELLTSPFDRAVWEKVSSRVLHVRIGNAPVATGRDASLDTLAAFIMRIEGFGCKYCELWQRRAAIYAETEVHFRDQGGALCAIPCAVVARAPKGELVDLRFHLDPSPIL
jgi:hypothetical protein